jgi:hypothetical protein
MALGTFGSTLNDELNRLANGGTYRDMNQMVDEALAAKQWANRENINPYSTDTVGILNEIAGLGLDKKNWLDFNGVCNYIAGTTGLPAAAALRQVYPTTDLLTGVASYYVDAAYPTGLTSTPGYVYLNGAAGNNMSTPDSNALDISSDIDIRAQIALDDWTPASDIFVVSKTASGNDSYSIIVNAAGTIRLSWVNSSATTINANSTVAPTIADGGTLWIRATLDADNGASGNTVTFFTSNDGTNWTQLGSTVTQAGVTNIRVGTAPLYLGAYRESSQMMSGKFYRAQIRNGIDGTVVFDANMANVSLTATSFTESSSNAATVTINGFRAYPQTADNLGAAGSLLPTTLGSSTAADSNDPKFLDHTGTNYVYTPGTSGNIAVSVTDATPLDITGDIDLRAYVALDDWTPATTNELFSKWGTAPDRSWIFRVIPAGNLELVWSNDGTTIITKTSTVAPTIADGSPLWVRATLDVDNGASGNDVKFFTSTDGVTYTQLGSTVTTAGVTSIYNSTTQVRDQGGSNFRSGKLFRLQLFAGLGGTDKRLDIDTSVITAGSATSLTAVTGQTVTIARSTSGRKTVAVTQPTWLFGTDDYMEVNNRYMSSGTYLYLPGVASNNCTTPDAAALDITGDIDLRVKVAMDDWTPAAIQYLLSKYQTSSQRSYGLTIGTNGRPSIVWSTDGTATGLLGAEATVAPTVADGATLWIRATLDVNNGASGNDVKFYTSTDGTTWTQLGATVTQAGTTSIFNSTSVLEVGSVVGGTSNAARGKFFRAQVLNGIDGTVAFDANFETSITSLLQASFTESSANAATVTINRSGSTYRSAGITAAGYLYPGATNTFSASATDFLNFGPSDSMTALAVWRQWTTTGDRRIIASSFSGGGGVYNISSLTSNRGYFQVSDLTFFPTSTVNITDGSLAVLNGVRNVPLDRLEGYLNTASSVNATDTTTGTLRNFGTFRIGAQFNGIFADAEIYAAAIFRSALTAAQARQIANYFINREVYL